MLSLKSRGLRDRGGKICQKSPTNSQRSSKLHTKKPTPPDFSKPSQSTRKIRPGQRRYQRERDGVQAAGEARRADIAEASDKMIAKMNADLAARDAESQSKGRSR
jgi:hypothetical protein